MSDDEITPVRHIVGTGDGAEIRESKSSTTLRAAVPIKGSIDEMNAGAVRLLLSPRHRAFHRAGLTYMPGSSFDGVPETTSWMRDEGPAYGRRCRRSGRSSFGRYLL